MANRYANLVGSNKIKDEWQKINDGFDKVEQDVDQLRVDLDQEIADREAAVEYVGQRVDNIIVGGGPDKDPELVDIRTVDPSYTPQREINVAGDVTRDMQAQFAAHKAETVTEIINVKQKYGTNKQDIQGAISDASTGALLYFPPGVYELSGIIIDKPLTIDGVGAIFKLENYSNTGLFEIVSEGVTIQNVTLDGNKNNQSNIHALVVVNAEQFVMQNVVIKNSYSYCLILELGAKYSKIIDNYFIDNGVIANCNAITCKGSHSEIRGNIIRNHGNGWGIRTGRFNSDPEQKVEHVLVVGNIVDNIDHVAMGPELDAQYNIFSNNQISNAPQAIKGDDSDRHIITGNIMRNISLTTAVNLVNVPECVISDNYLTDSGGGIRAGVNSTISNNRLENIAISGSATEGIRAIDASTVEGNYLVDCNNVGILSTGNGSKIIDNTIVATKVSMIRAISVGNGNDMIISGNTLIVKDEGSIDQGIRTLSSNSNYIVSKNILTAATSPLSDGGVEPKIVADNLL